MNNSHIKSTLALKNISHPIDEHTKALFHFDHHAYDHTGTIRPLGVYPDIEDGLVAYYDFSKEQSVAYDLSGNDNHGTIVGATWGNGRNGKALSFNGISNRFTTPKIEVRSVELWMWRSSAVSSPYYLIDARPDLSNSWIYNNTPGSNVSKLYINGAEQASMDVLNIPADQWSHVYIEYAVLGVAEVTLFNRYVNSEGLAGKLARAAVYNRILSEEEIQAHYNEGIYTIRGIGEGRFGGAIAIEEGTENPIPSSNIFFEGWAERDGANVSIIQNQFVPEWNTDRATRIQSSGGTTVQKYWYSQSSSSLPTSWQIYVKNIGSNIMGVSVDTGIFSVAERTQFVRPGESKKLEWAYNGTTAHSMRLVFVTENIADTIDCLAWQPQIEFSSVPTSFVDGAREDGSLVLPVDLGGEYTISCFRKGNGDAEFRHVVKRSDGKVFVDGVEDSEYDVGWIAGRNLVLDSEMEHSFTNAVFTKPLRADIFQELIGKELTLSFEAKAETVGQKMDWYLRNNSSSSIIPGSNHSSTELSAEYTRFSYTITLTDISDVTNLSFAFRNTSGVSPIIGPVYVKNIKIEKGSTATHWTPAPEEMGVNNYIAFSKQTGLLDELRIDDIARTDEEIMAFYLSSAPFFPRDKIKVIG